ncbi:aldehyde:ferredoxin oxidoreductase [Anaerolineales bacterium]|nr:aldehyde:ferredoxin oxidoreductase [Anaerolineales bacterium]
MTISASLERPALLGEYKYELRPVERGYANRTLYINLEDNSIHEKPVTQQMKDLFTGGRGFGLKLLWDAVTPDTKWDDPRNELVIANGPICGITAYPGSGKSTVVTLSPLTENVVDSNVGGYFAPFLKFSGFDALEVQGKAAEDVVIFIDGDTGLVTIENSTVEGLDAHEISAQLTEKYGGDERGKRAVSVLSAGQAADHVRIGMLNSSWYDVRRKEARLKQAARGGPGRVFRDKKIKAIVVRFSDMGGDKNGVVDMALIRKAGSRINKEIADLDDKQNQIRKIGTANIVEVMDHFDLLPTHNFRYGSHPDTHKIDSKVWKQAFTQNVPDGCWLGCTLSCSHGVDHFQIKTGPYAGQCHLVDGPEYENAAGLGSNIGNFDPQKVLELNFYCDTYGVDTISFANCVAFAQECYESGQITKEHTGGMELTFQDGGTVGLELIHQMARGEGFGVLVGQGVRYMKKYFAENFGADPAFMQDIGMEIKGMEISEYLTKESLAQQGGFGLATKGPQHDEAWLIFMDQVLNLLPTFKDKAEALHYFPMWRTWFSLHGLCKLPWNDITPENNKQTKEPAKVVEHVENYCWIHEGVTGKPTTTEDLLNQSERVYNFQKVFALRMGRVGRKHDYPPFRAMGPVTKEEYESRQERYDEQLKRLVEINPEGMSTEEKIKHLRKYREGQYEQLMDAVYLRRGWDANSIPTPEKLHQLGMDLPELLEVVEQARKTA